MLNCRSILQSKGEQLQQNFSCTGCFIIQDSSASDFLILQGRPTVDDLVQMLAWVDEYNATHKPRQPIRTSVELEKRRDNLGKNSR